jgi:hypothetical protein
MTSPTWFLVRRMDHPYYRGQFETGPLGIAFGYELIEQDLGDPRFRRPDDLGRISRLGATAVAARPAKPPSGRRPADSGPGVAAQGGGWAGQRFRGTGSLAHPTRDAGGAGPARPSRRDLAQEADPPAGATTPPRPDRASLRRNSTGTEGPYEAIAREPLGASGPTRLARVLRPTDPATLARWGPG